jgi:Ni,Fe-hydrogenase I small subunit
VAILLTGRLNELDVSDKPIAFFAAFIDDGCDDPERNSHETLPLVGYTGEW